MSNKVYITGLGIISAIGNNVEDTLDFLNKQKTGVTSMDNIVSRYQHQLPVGEVKASNAEL